MKFPLLLVMSQELQKYNTESVPKGVIVRILVYQFKIFCIGPVRLTEGCKSRSHVLPNAVSSSLNSRQQNHMQVKILLGENNCEMLRNNIGWFKNHHQNTCSLIFKYPKGFYRLDFFPASKMVIYNTELTYFPDLSFSENQFWNQIQPLTRFSL